MTFSISRNRPGVYDITIGTDSVKLNVSEVQTLPPLKPAEFVTSELSITPLEMKSGDTATVNGTVTNIGNKQGTCLVTFKVNGVVEDSRDIILAGGDSKSFNFTITKSQPGTYTIIVSSDGYKEQKHTVTVGSGEKNSLELNLQKVTAELADTTKGEKEKEKSKREKSKLASVLDKVALGVFIGFSLIILLIELTQDK